MWIWLLQGEQHEKRWEGDKLWLIYMFISKVIQTISFTLCSSVDLFPDCNILVIVVLQWVMILLPSVKDASRERDGFFFFISIHQCSSAPHSTGGQSGLFWGTLDAEGTGERDDVWWIWYVVFVMGRERFPQESPWAWCAVSQNIMTCHKLL